MRIISDQWFAKSFVTVRKTSCYFYNTRMTFHLLINGFSLPIYAATQQFVCPYVSVQLNIKNCVTYGNNCPCFD